VNNFKSVQTHVRNIILIAAIFQIIFALGTTWVAVSLLDIPVPLAIGIGGVLGTLLAVVISFRLPDRILEPLKAISDAILHVSPGHSSTPAPNPETLRLGRELISGLALEVYQLASHASSQNDEGYRKELIQATTIVSRLPLPLFVFNKDQFVTNASEVGMAYCGVTSAQLFGKPLYENVKLEFPSEHTLEDWITECQSGKITDTAYWERVRVRLTGNEAEYHQCDIAAHYDRDNPSGTEFIITFFDRSKQYNQDDQAVGFVALAVHELRTPLTMLRGYIEVFEEELSDKLDGELKDFMHKMHVSADQLTAFVNNILNVARVDENQLVLRLDEQDWLHVLQHAIEDMSLKAQVHGKTIQCEIEPNLPMVAVDRISIYEVINNLIDNAIKYSGESKVIRVESHMGKDGMIETTVQDGGVGVPESVLPNLFEKFYRNHRTKSQVGGTGLGLYLCKAIVTAHGGQIWAKSKEGEGSTFGFSLQPYSNLADELKKGNNKDIVHSAHGWIKNHSLYRR
jgi:signal transduction histidine kinase